MSMMLPLPGGGTSEKIYPGLLVCYRPHIVLWNVGYSGHSGSVLLVDPKVLHRERMVELMSNYETCNELVKTIKADLQTFLEYLPENYIRATLEDIEDLVIAKRRIRIAMTRLGIEY